MATKVDIDLMPSNDRDNFIRLTRLLIAAGTPILRELFDSYHPPQHLASRLNSQRTLLETTAKLTRPQKESLFSASGVPDSKKFDLTLLVKLLRNICFSTAPTCGWDGFPDNDDVSLQDDVVRIRFYRNEIYAHVRAEMSLSSEYFQKLWKDISEALCRIASKFGNLIKNEVEEKILKLRFSLLTNDDISKYKEIQDTLAGHEETLDRHEEQLIRHEEQLTRQDETLTRHDDALSRIDTQGNEIHKEMKGLQDKVFQNAVAHNSKHINSTKIGSENLTQNINNITFNLITDQRQLESLINTPKQTAINQPPGTFLQGVRAALSSPPFVERSMSCPKDLHNFHGPRMDDVRHPIQFPTRPGRASISSEPEQIPASQLILRNQTFNQDQSGIDVGAPEFVPGKRWSKGNDHLSNQTHRRASYPEFPVSTSPPSSPPNCLGFDTHSPGTNWQSNPRPTNLLNSKPIFTISDQVQESKRSFQFPTSPSDASISSLPEQIPTYRQLRGRNQTLNQSQSGIDISAPEFLPGKRWSKGNDQPSNQAHRRESYPECTVSTVKPINTSSDQIQASNWSFPPGAASNSSNMSGKTRDSTSQLMEIYPQVSSLSISTRKQNNNDDEILHINVCVLGSPSSKNVHLGRLISESLSVGDNGFRRYLERTRQLKITKVDDSQSGFCSIGVSASDISSLEGLWRDCMTNDLTQFLKGTVLPSDFDAHIDVSIDGKEYEACWKRLKPRDLREIGKTSYSQSFSHTEELSDKETDPRSRSMEELSSSKRAFDELFLLICKNGGRLEYITAVKQLSPSEEIEISKAILQGKMDDRFSILPNKVIQARFNFCHNRVDKDGGSKCDDPNCPNLHLCPYFLLDVCAFSDKCKSSHDISDAHTSRIFKKANIFMLSLDERFILLINVAYTVPEICTHYMKNRCTKGSECPYLHVCKCWVLDTCFLKEKCPRAHTFTDPPSKRILQERNLHEISEKEIKEYIKMQFAPS